MKRGCWTWQLGCLKKSFTCGWLTRRKQSRLLMGQTRNAPVLTAVSIVFWIKINVFDCELQSKFAQGPRSTKSSLVYKTQRVLMVWVILWVLSCGHGALLENSLWNMLVVISSSASRVQCQGCMQERLHNDEQLARSSQSLVKGLLSLTSAERRVTALRETQKIITALLW